MVQANVPYHQRFARYADRERRANNTHNDTYGAVIMAQSHCKSSPGSFGECRLSIGWPPTLKPSQPSWAVNLPMIGGHHPHPPES